MASDHWFRFYNTAIDSPKVLQLNDTQFRAWVALMALASKMNGIIPNNVELIAKTLRKSRQKTSELLQVLLGVRLLDMTDSGDYTPHNWQEKQYKSDISTDRVKRFRERKRNVSETDQRQRQRQRQKKEQKVRTRGALTRFDDFWAACPKKVGRGKAEQSYRKVSKTVSEEILIAAMQRYARSRIDQDPTFTKHPATWLNQQCWDDEPDGARAPPRQTAFNSPEEQEAQRKAMEAAYGPQASKQYP